MALKIPLSAEAFHFLDASRVAFYDENQDFVAEHAPYPVWRLPASYGADIQSHSEHYGAIADIVSRLDTTGHLAHGARTPADPWLANGSRRVEGSYRLEQTPLRRITMPGNSTHIWYARSDARHLFLCEHWKDCHEPAMCSLWRGYDLAPIFNQLLFRPLMETTLDTSLLFAHQTAFRHDPVETLCHLGATASTSRDVHVLYGLRDAVFPLSDDAQRTALFGYPIAIWEQNAPPSEPKADADLSNVLIFFSVDDPGTHALMSQIKESRLLKSFDISFAWAIDQYSGAPDLSAQSLTTRLRDALARSKAQGLIVHLGAAYSGNSDAYRESLTTIASEFPHVAITFDQENYDAQFPEVAVSEASELRELVEYIFH